MKAKSSCVYFLQVGIDGPIKIGTTVGHVSVRMKALQQTSPHILRWIGFFEGGTKEESQAHRNLSASNLRGEWFHPTAEVLAFVQAKCPNFDERTYNAEVFCEREREIVKAIITPWSRDRSRLAKVCEESGIRYYDMYKWLSSKGLPDPAKARKAAECATQILLASQTTSAGAGV